MSDQNWLSRTQPGSFRGVTFLTDSHEARMGRRLAVSDLPGAEVPVVQDLGAKSGKWRVNAYFIGPNYDLARAALLEVLNTPGADWLTHPWLGRILVRAEDWAVADSTDKGGYGTVVIEFVPGGGDALEPTTDAVDVASTSVDNMMTVSQQAFKLAKLSSTAMSQFLVAVSNRLEVMRDVLALASMPLSMAQQVQAAINGIKVDLNELMAVPGRYAVAMTDLANVLGGSAERLADAAGRSGLSGLPASPAQLALVSKLATMATSTATVEAMQVDTVADAVSVRQSLLAESALRGQLLVAAAASLSLVDYTVADDRNAALVSITDSIDALLPSMPDEVFQAAVSARAAVSTALASQDLATLTTRTVFRPTPAAVLAYRMGIDEQVFIDRNKVRHPLFVSGVIRG